MQSINTIIKYHICDRLYIRVMKFSEGENTLQEVPWRIKYEDIIFISRKTIWFRKAKYLARKYIFSGGGDNWQEKSMTPVKRGAGNQKVTNKKNTILSTVHNNWEGRLRTRK